MGATFIELVKKVAFVNKFRSIEDHSDHTIEVVGSTPTAYDTKYFRKVFTSFTTCRFGHYW